MKLVISLKKIDTNFFFILNFLNKKKFLKITEADFLEFEKMLLTSIKLTYYLDIDCNQSKYRVLLKKTAENV